MAHGRPPKKRPNGLYRTTLTHLSLEHLQVLDYWAQRLGCSRGEALGQLIDGDALRPDCVEIIEAEDR